MYRIAGLPLAGLERQYAHEGQGKGTLIAMRVSRIVTTYNWPQALGLTLAGVARQCALPQEVIVADDGSGAEIAQTLRAACGARAQGLDAHLAKLDVPQFDATAAIR